MKDFSFLGKVAEKLGHEKFSFLLDSMFRWEKQKRDSMQKVWWHIYEDNNDCLYWHKGEEETIYKPLESLLWQNGLSLLIPLPLIILAGLINPLCFLLVPLYMWIAFIIYMIYSY